MEYENKLQSGVWYLTTNSNVSFVMILSPGQDVLASLDLFFKEQDHRFYSIALWIFLNAQTSLSNVGFICVGRDDINQSIYRFFCG